MTKATEHFLIGAGLVVAALFVVSRLRASTAAAAAAASAVAAGAPQQTTTQKIVGDINTGEDDLAKLAVVDPALALVTPGVLKRVATPIITAIGRYLTGASSVCSVDENVAFTRGDWSGISDQCIAALGYPRSDHPVDTGSGVNVGQLGNGLSGAVFNPLPIGTKVQPAVSGINLGFVGGGIPGTVYGVGLL